MKGGFREVRGGGGGRGRGGGCSSVVPEQTLILLRETGTPRSVGSSEDYITHELLLEKKLVRGVI